MREVGGCRQSWVGSDGRRSGPRTHGIVPIVSVTPLLVTAPNGLKPGARLADWLETVRPINGIAYGTGAPYDTVPVPSMRDSLSSSARLTLAKQPLMPTGERSMPGFNCPVVTKFSVTPGAGTKRVFSVQVLPRQGAVADSASGRLSIVPLLNGMAAERSIDVGVPVATPVVNPTILTLAPGGAVLPNGDIEP